MIWGTFLTDLREDLQDTSESNPAYTSRLLYLYALDGMRDYSQYFPLRVDALEIEGVDGRFPLPANYIEDITVECPRGKYLTPRPILPGMTKIVGYVPTRYEIEGGGIYLDAPTTESIWLTYYAYHTFPTSEVDTDAEISIPDGDTELLRLYIRARIAAQLRMKTARNDRYREDARRDDNPLEDEFSHLMAEYHNKISARTHTVAIFLRKQRG